MVTPHHFIRPQTFYTSKGQGCSSELLDFSNLKFSCNDNVYLIKVKIVIAAECYKHEVNMPSLE